MIHGDLLGERARLSPEVTALVEVASDRRFTYRELDRRAAGCARVWLEALGLGHGDRVGVLAGNRVELLDAFFAAGKSGVIVVPLSTRATVRELETIATDCGLAALMYDAEHAETAAALRGRVAIPHGVALDEPVAGDQSYGGLVARLAARPWRRVRCAPEDVYCLLYTSGTTGRAKGVMIPHRMVAWNGYNTVACWQLEASDVSPVFTPLYHAGGLGAFLVPIFTVGGTVILHQRFDPAEVLATIAAERCTVVLGVPTIFTMLIQAPEFARTDLASVRWFISGGAPLPRTLVDAFAARGVVLRQGYGLTEVGVNCFAMSDEEAWAKVGSVGRPLMFTEARAAGADGDEVATGDVGELQFRGPHVSLGYWNAPDATAAVLDADGWFHTGDLARFDGDGFCYIVGRAKDLIISGGVNIYPAEVEHALLEHPGVVDAAVVGVPHTTWGEVGVAFVVVVPGEAPTPAELAAHLGERISKLKIPKDFILLDELPRTPYGKVLKSELADRYRPKEAQ